MKTEDLVIPVIAFSLGASLLVVYLIIERLLNSPTGSLLPTVVSRRTEYVRDSSGRIIEKYEEVSLSDGTIQEVRSVVPSVATQGT